MRTFLIVCVCLIVLTSSPLAHAAPQPPDGEPPAPAIQLRSRIFVPEAGVAAASNLRALAPGAATHLLLQFKDVVRAEQRALLAENGVALLGYIPQNAWLASVARPVDLTAPQFDFIRWAGPLQPADKISPALREGTVGAWATDADGRVTLQVLFFADVDMAAAAALLAAQGGSVIQRSGALVVAQFPSAAAIQALAALDPVQWIDNGPAPRYPRDTNRGPLGPANDGARGRTGVNALQSAVPDAIGTGVKVAIFDGMVDAGHPDFTGRITVVTDLFAPGAAANDHGTHVAGTVGGDGRNSEGRGGTPNQWRGVAYGANLFSFPNDGAFFGNHQNAIVTRGADISSNSWGGNFTAATCNTHNNYSADSQQMDQIAAGAYTKRIVVSVAASNFRGGQSDNQQDQSPICNYSDQAPFLNYASLSDLGSAKNIITVGATKKNAADSMADFSSWGPTKDGRLKPDVVAPGDSIQSPFPGGGYGTQSGTSMATPHVSGVAALVIQRYRTVFQTQQFRGETIKALLIQTARDLVSDNSEPLTAQYYRPGPDFASGYGIVDAQAAWNAVAVNRILEGAVAHQAVVTRTLVVTAGVGSVKATLVWNDPASQPNSCDSFTTGCTLLINNLDLELEDPNGAIHQPWILNPATPGAAATRGVDNRNAVEQVQADTPEAGTWIVRVRGANLAAGPQAFALVVDPPFATPQLAQKVFLPAILR